ncbi:MAG: flagellar hook-associated protein FlgK [Planctomycetes bacterium]|nr:flagellar hook-associated protein FlgK [Planctomycetota bacterium]
MGLINSALHIGRNALLGYQSALQVIGSNISSAGSPNYTRLSPQLDPLQGVPVAGGLQPGAGVTLTGIRRSVDDALENRLRLATGQVEATRIEQSALAQAETLFDDVGGAGVATRLSDFFNSFDDLQNSPEDVAARDLVIANGKALASSLSVLRSSLTNLSGDLDSQIPGLVAQADDLAAGIAQLNDRIARSEAAKRGQATGLRDQRDGLLRQLGEIVDVTVREEQDGSINVYVGSESLIQAGVSRGLTTVRTTSEGVTRTRVVFAGSGASVATRGGKLAGLIRARDEHTLGRIQAIDDLASALIAEVNRVHADGQGAVGYRSIVAGASLLATDVPLDRFDAGLNIAPSDGSFFIAVADDATGTVVAHRIDISLTGQADDTTLASLVEQINANVPGVTASITADNRFAIDAADGFTFTFGHDGQVARTDSSGLLSALGVNTFFQGSDATDIAVRDNIASDPRLLAAAGAGAIGDGTNAGKMAALQTSPSERLAGRSVIEAFNAVSTNVAVIAAAANAGADSASSIFSALAAQRESISGVSLDEEAIELLKFERAFQGAARYVGVVDDLIRELMNLVI